jgi:four helix bundle protein
MAGSPLPGVGRQPSYSNSHSHRGVASEIGFVDIRRVRDHRRLTVWTKARDVAIGIYRITDRFPAGDSLTKQMRRSAISVVSNIAEGAAHHSERQFVRFLEIAGASAGELQAQLDIAIGLGHCESRNCEPLLDLIDEVKAMLFGLARTVRGADPG